MILISPDFEDILDLGHTGRREAGPLHPKALAFIRGEEPDVRKQIGEALRDLQKGVSIGLPLSRPMPTVASVFMN